MIRKKLKWYSLFKSRDELDSFLMHRESAVYRSVFGEVLLVRDGEEFLAFRNRCPHQNKSLEGCRVIDHSIVCPFHQYRFSVENGRGHGMYIDKYALRISEEGVFLGKEVWTIF